MSHQSGIQARDRIIMEMANAQQDNTRVLCVKIQNEQLVLTHRGPIKADWKADYESNVLPLLDPSHPCYILYKLDSQSVSGPDWIMISWVPDVAAVRDKMLYASTRSTLRKQFGDHLIKHDINGSVVSDVNLNGFEQFLTSKSAPGPLTAAEEYKTSLLSNEDAVGLFTGRQTVGSVSFQLTPDAVQAVRKFSQNESDYVQLAIDCDREVINCAVSLSSLEPQSLVKHTPINEGRYHLYRFQHMKEGRKCSAILFIHTISGYQGSIKSRMLYSSCKSALVFSLENDFHIQFQLRLETDNAGELDEDYIMKSLYPPPVEQKRQFVKPAGPAGRRPRSQFT